MVKPTGKIPNQSMMCVAGKVVVCDKQMLLQKRLAINVQPNAMWKVYAAKIDY